MTQKHLAARIGSHNNESSVLHYGDERIEYDIIRRKSQADSTSPRRKVTLKVHPDLRVVATAPHDASNDDIHQIVTKRARWIWDNLQQFAEQQSMVLPRQYVSGETQFYLGRRYVLKVTPSETQRSDIKLYRGKLQVTVSAALYDAEMSRQAKVKGLLKRWYADKSQQVLSERISQMVTKTPWVNETPSFRIMEMKKQWGSCSASGSLLFNPHLIKAPKECIDYVVLHELCHIAEHNHSEKFWRLLTQVMPNWKQVKSQLDGMAELYLND